MHYLYNNLKSAVAVRVIVLAMSLSLISCSANDSESTLKNTVALFESNGLKLNPELEREIGWASKNIIDKLQLEAELTKLKALHKTLMEREEANREFPTDSTTDLKSQKYTIRNRATALQIIAYHNDWSIDEQFRFQPGEL